MANTTHDRPSAHSFKQDAEADAAGSGYGHNKPESLGDKDAMYIQYMERTLAIQAEQHAAFAKMNRKMDNVDVRMGHVEATLTDVKEQLEDINVVKEKFEEHVEEITADVENLKRQRNQDIESLQRQRVEIIEFLERQRDADRDKLTIEVEDLKRKLEAHANENGGAKRRRAAPTKQGKGKNADEQAFIALPEDTQYLNLDQVMEFGLRSVVRADSKYLTVNRNEDIELKRVGNKVRGKVCRGFLHTRSKAGEIVQREVQFLVTDQCDRRNKFPQDSRGIVFATENLIIRDVPYKLI